jgi:hypothetical protein
MHVGIADAMPLQAIHGTLQQTFGEQIIEARDDDGHAQPLPFE